MTLYTDSKWKENGLYKYYTLLLSNIYIIGAKTQVTGTGNEKYYPALHIMQQPGQKMTAYPPVSQKDELD